MAPSAVLLLLLACTGSAPADPVPPKALPSTTPPAPGEPRAAQPALPTVSLLVDGKVVVAEVADDPDERAAGLMFRAQLDPGHGMLFVYPGPRPRSFWMKNTVLPLSIAYIDAAGTIVSTHDMVPLSERPVRSLAAAQYALEVPQGWLAAQGITAGDRVEGLPGPSLR